MVLSPLFPANMAVVEERDGCEHYCRGCLLKAPCCSKFYVCRLCHDSNEDHQMDRFKVQEVQCAKCEKVQQAQQNCENCNSVFGEYYCSTCHLFDKDKNQYHCEMCGICRLKIMLCRTWFHFTLVESTFMEVNMEVTNWNHAQVETGDDGARCKMMTGAEALWEKSGILTRTFCNSLVELN